MKLKYFDGYDDDEPAGEVVECNRCGATDLHWQEIVKADGKPGWALFTERNRKHDCTAKPDADEFPKG